MTDSASTPPGPSGPSGLDTSQATPARIYDCLLGGKDNYPADRAAAARIAEIEPNSRRIVSENRSFLERAVTHLVAEVGIRQIIDLGSGLPTQNNVHQIAHETDPATRVVYVDNDPQVLVHGRALLEDNPHTAVITADLRAADQVLDHPDTQRLIDFDHPWALLAVAVFHFVPQDPGAILRPYVQRMPAGAHLALTHVSQDATTPDVMQAVVDVYRGSATAPMVPRSRAEITALFTGFDLVPPGIDLIMNWRRGIQPSNPHDVPLFGGVGRRTTAPL